MPLFVYKDPSVHRLHPIYFEGNLEDITAYLEATKKYFRKSDLRSVKLKKITHKVIVAAQKKDLRRQQREVKKELLHYQKKATALEEKLSVLDEGKVAGPIKRKRKPAKKRRASDS